MYVSLVFLPLIGSIVSGLFGRSLGAKGSTEITTSCLFISFLGSVLGFYEVALSGASVYIKLNSWVQSDFLKVDWGFMFDSLAVSMCVVVTFISVLVHLYSIEYMASDPHVPRFMSYLSLFTFFMLILITSDNFIQMFVGWEGVGLCSYLLINFWFTRIQANKAAIKAMLLNRIGDFSLLIGIFLVIKYYKSTNYVTVAALSPFFLDKSIIFLTFEVSLVETIAIFLFIGAMGKSAQLGLHTWLPDAMEGPTPVSALIHAATMVTASIFSLARCSFFFDYSENVLTVASLIGGLTAFFAASVGLVQNDLKRVIAYSTCSQLGYMIFACGLSGYSVGVFHLINHAFFKALLFLAAGSVIHSVSDEQDMRKMGGLRKIIPFTYAVMVIGSLALIGFPFLTGYYSKDLVLELAYGNYQVKGHFCYALGALSAFFTAFYSTRLGYLTFLSKPNGYKRVICYAQEPGRHITAVLAILALPSVIAGYYLKELFVGIGSPLLGMSISTNPAQYKLIDSEFIPVFYKVCPVILSFLGVLSGFVGFYFYSKSLFKLKSSVFGKKAYVFLSRKWFFDKIYNECISQFFFKFGYSTSYKLIDRGVFESLGPTGLVVLASTVGDYVHKAQTGHLYHYTLVTLVGATSVFFIREAFLISRYFDLNEFIILFVLLLFLVSTDKDDCI